MGLVLTIFQLCPFQLFYVPLLVTPARSDLDERLLALPQFLAEDLQSVLQPGDVLVPL